MTDPTLHNMKTVQRRTGLSPHLIRVWERRYGAVTPARSVSLRRLYTEEEVERLVLLARLTQSGMAISRIATLPLPELRAVAEGLPDVVPLRPGLTVEACVETALAALRQYDMGGFEAALDGGMLAFGYSGLLEKVMVPLLRRIGDEWAAGQLTAGHEHGATAAMKDYLARNLPALYGTDQAPRLLVTTPAGQLHEMGAAIAAGLARKAGWQVTYLGPSLPAEEIAGAVLRFPYRAVALSLIYPGDDPALPGQLRRLRHLLPAGMPILVGGRAVASYRAVLEEIGAGIIGEMGDFGQMLDALREPAADAGGTSSGAKTSASQ